MNDRVMFFLIFLDHKLICFGLIYLHFFAILPFQLIVLLFLILLKFEVPDALQI